jgi:coproporphyrinogen III oxidase
MIALPHPPPLAPDTRDARKVMRRVTARRLAAVRPRRARIAVGALIASPVARGASPPSLRDRVAKWIEEAHDSITADFLLLDRGGSFREDSWNRPGGGRGVTRVMTDGETFEKAGVNRFSGGGPLPIAVAERLGARVPAGHEARFFACGVSVVVHPRSPLIPSIHLNVRYFEIEDCEGNTLDAWFGGGTDLTPTYPFFADAAHFHRALADVCGRHSDAYYPRFKAWCDEYFTNAHRDGEMRGIGGIFFDNLRASDRPGASSEDLFAFVRDVAAVVPRAYGPIVDRRRCMPFGAREREFQLVRRGRYVEFNLIHDRGTLFGLQTHARTESVLMSLPPHAAWEYAPIYAPGSFESRLGEMLRPRDWLTAREGSRI